VPACQLVDAQLCVAHACVAEGAGAGHAWSGSAAPCRSTHDTVRDWTPPPQGAEHAEKAPVAQVPLGQVAVLQASCSSGRGVVHAVSATRWPAASTQRTVREWVPPPQAAEQAPHASVTQVAPVHAWVLHACEEAGAVMVQAPSGSTAPVASTQCTPRDCRPPPHETSQVDQAPVTQVPAEQLATSQACCAGGGVCWQAATGATAPVDDKQVTVRCCVPGPHGAEHVDQLPVAHA
jgi:hypothetical protein